MYFYCDLEFPDLFIQNILSAENSGNKKPSANSENKKVGTLNDLIERLSC